jgi:predicted metal-dependent hydrolase
MYVNKINDRAHREKIMLKWYRQQLEEKITTLLAYWQKLIGVSPAKWRLRKMKTKWGTCNIKYNRICFNPELAKNQPNVLNTL